MLMNGKSAGQSDTEAFGARVDREMLREGRRTALRVAAAQSAPGVVIYAVILKVLGNSLASASEILSDKGEFWYESFMPCVLTALFGGLLGAGLGWRITSVSGLSGMPGWTIGASAVLAVGVLGVLLAKLVLTISLSAMTFVATGAMVLAALALISFFALWSE